jgi:ketosteroid isomerase-like protein
MALTDTATDTATTNAALLERGYEAFASGDIPTVLELFAETITWHVPGRSPLSGDYTGHPGVLDFFDRCQRFSEGTLQVVPQQILASGDRVVVLCTVSAHRAGRDFSSPEVHVWRFVDGLAVEFVEYQGDQEAEDEFWMS